MSYMTRTAGLVKRYGRVVALDGLDLEVPKRTVMGLIGPNGADKTTAVRILKTLPEPDDRFVEIATSTTCASFHVHGAKIEALRVPLSPRDR